MKTTYLAVLASAGLLSACAVVPTGPSVMALPGTGKTFNQFQNDDAMCRSFAFRQVGGQSTNDQATASALGSAAIGTALGAAAGAAFGGGRGAAVGAGAGLLAGSTVGMSNAQGSQWDIQRRFDYAYLQCMYAQGNRIPMQGRMIMSPPAQSGPPQQFMPPPPPGSPPPPGW